MEQASWALRILVILIASFVLWRIVRAKAGKTMYLRKVPGLDKVDEAVGRATEMGRPIMFNPGYVGLSVELFCDLACMQHIVRQAAKVGTNVLVPVVDPLAYAICEEYWKDAYAMEGRAGLFSPEDSVRFLTGDQAVYASSTSGWMERERVGANFLWGYYGWESLFLAESGQRAGAIQISCVFSYYQVPFLIVSCDYTAFGEEFYAAGAYFGRDPVLLGSLSGQDISKVLILALIIIGSVLAVLGGKYNPLFMLLYGT
ncbi:MAG TPA: DUF6754 domain-containing protein [Vicinamibacterales bacterium]|nr:DUF6754 domain-containing protein [Vicinamibacterales bacterium]